MPRGPIRRGARHTWVALTKVPMLADHRGMRWLLNGRVMPGGPLAVLTHRGRRTARTYRTPVEVIAADDESGEIVLLPARGRRSDWYHNVMAGGLVAVRLRGTSYAAGCRELSEDESVRALDRYTTEHPRWGRMILKGLARNNDLAGDPSAAVAKELPIVAMKLTPNTEHRSPK